MLVVSCTKCEGWVAVIADENDRSGFADAVRDEGLKPNRKITITKDAYDERAFGLTGACRASYGAHQACDQ